MAWGHGHWTGYEEITGQTLDISEWTDFEFYDLVWCWWHVPGKPNMTDKPRCLARWLGVWHHVGSDLCYWLLTKYGKIVSNLSVQHVTHDDYLKEDKQKEIEAFDQKLKEQLDDKNFVVPGEGFAGMFLEDIDDLVNDSGGIIHEEDHTPSNEDFLSE
jgi:hypothetical protein